MSLFNQKRKKAKQVINRGGGRSFRQDPKMELVSILLTSFAQDQFYRGAKQTFSELINLMDQVDPLFAAKAAVFARREYGMRSITHVLAGHLAKHSAGQEWAKAFYAKVVRRPDDMLEILAYYYALGNTKLPNAMKKGFAKSFDQFDGYQLAKYRGESKAVKLVDLVNLVHPLPTQRNARALEQLVKDELKSTQTWEAKLTKAGQNAENQEEKLVQKAQAWKELIRNKRLGYFALLRNLRNIAEQAPEVLGEAIAILTNRNLIKKSMVLPFRFLTAQEAIASSTLSIKKKRSLQKAINRALELSIDNVPVFDGRTLVVLDDSGSMTWGGRGMDKTPIQIGALFAAMLYKSNDADLMRFSDSASYVNYYYKDAALSISNRLIEQAHSAGTNFHAIFEKANKAYDRIIILSDMQGWVGYHAPVKAYEAYKQRFKADPLIYSFDLQGYGTMQLSNNKVFQLSGFSDKVFDLMKLLESDREALVNKIEAVEL